MLETWSRLHSVAALTAAAVASLTLRATPLALTMCGSFLVLLWLHWGKYTPGGSFGAANWVTLSRLVVILGLPVLPSAILGVALLAVLALDGLDGFLARRLRLTSAFGAHFDMEADALLVLIASFELWMRGVAGSWVLTSGALRYLYVLALWAVPARGGDAPRSRWGRFSFLILMLGLAAPWLIGARLGVPLAAGGCLVVTVSFARSFLYSYGALRS